MSKTKKFVYAVKFLDSDTTQIYTEWPVCQSAMKGHHVEFKKFPTQQLAKEWLCGVDGMWEKEILPRLKDGRLIAFVDGSFDNTVTPGKYGSGVIIYHPEHISSDDYITLSYPGTSPAYVQHRNAAGEIFAAAGAINYAVINGYKKLTIFHDHIGICAWATHEWKANTLLTNKYQDFVLDSQTFVPSIEFVKVDGHTNNKYNDLADAAAKKAVQLEPTDSSLF